MPRHVVMWLCDTLYIDRQLLTAVCQAVHAHVPVEAAYRFYATIPPCHCGVMWRSESDDKQSPSRSVPSQTGYVFGFGDQIRDGKLSTVVCLDHPDRKGSCFDKSLQKVFSAGGAVLRVHFPIRPACTLIFCCNLVTFVTLCYAMAGHMLYAI